MYLLRLTKEEATTLRIIGRHIGGAPEGRRGDMTSIVMALENAGIPDPGNLDIRRPQDPGCIFFENTRTAIE